jgi:hypothetical protein
MPIYLWIKITPDGRPTKIACEPEDDVDTLQKRIKEQLSPKFDQVPRDEIIVKDANNVIIDPGVGISSYGQSLGSSSKHPFLVDAPAPNTSSGISIPLLSHLTGISSYVKSSTPHLIHNHLTPSKSLTIYAVIPLYSPLYSRTI